MHTYSGNWQQCLIECLLDKTIKPGDQIQLIIDSLNTVVQYTNSINVKEIGDPKLLSLLQHAPGIQEYIIKNICQYIEKELNVNVQCTMKYKKYNYTLRARTRKIKLDI